MKVGLERRQGARIPVLESAEPSSQLGQPLLALAQIFPAQLLEELVDFTIAHGEVR